MNMRPAPSMTKPYVHLIRRLHRISLVVAVILTIAGYFQQASQIIVGFLAGAFLYSAIMRSLTAFSAFQRFLIAFLMCIVAAAESIIVSFILSWVGLMKLPTLGFEYVVIYNAIWIVLITALFAVIYGIQALANYVISRFTAKHE